MAVVSMKQFIEAGVHYGHQTRRWNPKMRPYIFGTKHGIHIVDLQKSLRMLKTGYEFVRDIAAKGDSVLFVGTKLQGREIIREEAIRSNSFYINERWLGGLLTNFNTVKQSIAQLKKLEDQRGEHGLYEGFIKKEAMRMEKRRIKLERALGGIKEMRKLPGAVFIVDCRKERIAVQEAQKLGVPIVAVVDTNCDPDAIDYIIPGNDDAIRAIGLFTSTIANAVLEGNALYEAQAKTVSEEKPRAPRGRGKGPKAEAERKAGTEKKSDTEKPGAVTPETPAKDSPQPVAAETPVAVGTPVVTETPAAPEAAPVEAAPPAAEIPATPKAAPAPAEPAAAEAAPSVAEPPAAPEKASEPPAPEPTAPEAAAKPPAAAESPAAVEPPATPEAAATEPVAEKAPAKEEAPPS